ncbi:metallophosphoesterase [Marmoricola endophyticus]|uniref:Metallophosphoesterase n=1 Tax=Marmoricola endophyticus TaxID=2040280 RepID=A0A917F4B2_9ACTN|nr:metallophosphoesterase [Marmoricola endophyticus]GGF49132.1 metallophosphoesterase [Marmoricola endophyticus]
MSTTRFLAGAAGALAVAGAGTAAYGYAATKAFVVRRADVPCLPAGHEPLRLLHLSDLHATPRQTTKLAWLRSLADLEPDLVVSTGDNLAHRDVLPPLLDALDPLLDRPGAFVLGSNDYYSPVPKSPLRYFRDDDTRSTHVAPLPWEHLCVSLARRGWQELTNTTGTIEVGGTTIALSGLDDPHLSRDDLGSIPRPAPADADLRLGVAHAPYLRVLDAYATSGWDMVLAGHTHGGQVCLPGGRALVTNCDLEPARASGLHRHPAASSPGDAGSAWLHVSAGAGTSPYAPFRTFCRPEATLLTLTPA